MYLRQKYMVTDHHKHTRKFFFTKKSALKEMNKDTHPRKLWIRNKVGSYDEYVEEE